MRTSSFSQCCSEYSTDGAGTTVVLKKDAIKALLSFRKCHFIGTKDPSWFV